MQTGLGGRHQAEFGTGALPEDRNPGREKALREGTAVIGDKILQKGRARRRARALQQIEILQEKRHAGERASGKPFLDLAFRIVVMLDHDRVDLRIDFCGAGNRLVEQIGRRDLFPADEIGQADRIKVAVFLESHVQTPMSEPIIDRPR